jgi:MarR family transcriptional regulator, 2-MHQ and catechol-resistance regulon repressor
MSDLKTLTTLFRAANSIERVIKEDVFKYGLNVSEFGVLEAIYHKGPMNVKDVLEKVLIANSSMSYVIDNLVTKGYLIRKQCIVDKRRFLLELSVKGKSLMDKIFPIHASNMRKILDILDIEEEIALQKSLSKIGKYAKEVKLNDL